MSRQVNLGQIIPNIQVGETITGNAGTQANVENTGTNLNPILNFTIPKGTTGSAGKDGKDGADAKINGINTLNIEAGTNITLDQQGSTLTINSTGGSGGTSDYSDLTNKPSINSITLSGNKTSSDLGVQPSTDNNLTTTNKTVTSAINEVNSIAKGANQAVGYNNYSAMITAINAMDDEEYNVGQNVYIVTVNVPDLWVSSVESTSSTYTYVDDATVVNDLETNGYIQVGYYKLSMLETQKVDLTNYVTNTDYATSSKGGVIRINPDYGSSVTSVGALASATKTYTQYNSSKDWMFIGKGTLENVITGKGLVSNTDYATATVGGVIKASNSYAVALASGSLVSTPKTYTEYSSMSNYGFIGKGTLENVINGKGLNISSINSGENVNITNLLPNGYTRLEYIESSGTQYIDPGIASSNTIGININYSYSTINSSTNAGICGIYQGTDPRTDCLLITTSSGKTNSNMFFAHRGITLAGGHSPSANAIYNVKINWRNSGVIDFEGQTTAVGTNNVESGAIHLFGRKSGSSYTYAPLKMYSCQFSDETKMIRNLIPAKRNSDSVIGMYDTVNGVFYENRGTGTFTAGAELDNIPKISFKNEEGLDLKQLSTFDSTKTQVLKNINGTLTWVDE